MVRENLELPVIRLNFTPARLILTGVLVASLGLAACGRKGPLDPPPGASLYGDPQANSLDQMSVNDGSVPIGGVSRDGHPGVDADGKPMAPVGPKRRIPLDVLLN